MTTQPDTFSITLTPATIAAMPRPVADWLAMEIARESREGKPTNISMPLYLALLDRKGSTVIKQRRTKSKPSA